MLEHLYLIVLLTFVGTYLPSKFLFGKGFLEKKTENKEKKEKAYLEAPGQPSTPSPFPPTSSAQLTVPRPASFFSAQFSNRPNQPSSAHLPSPLLSLTRRPHPIYR